MESGLQHQEGHWLCRFWRKKLCFLLGQDRFFRSYRLQRRTYLHRLGPTRFHHLGYDFKSTMRYRYSCAQYLEIVASTDRCELPFSLHIMRWCGTSSPGDRLQNRLYHCFSGSTHHSTRQFIDSTVFYANNNQRLLVEAPKLVQLKLRAIDSH